MLDKLLFKLKHWQMFLLALAGAILNVMIFQSEAGWRGIVGDILPTCAILLWLMLLGMRMKKHLPDRLARPYAAFIAGGMLLIAGMILVAIFKEDVQEYMRGKTLFMIVLFVAVLCITVSFLGFIACATKTLQRRGEVTVVDYGGDVFLWAVWWYGVWVLQPRLNLIYDQYFS